MFKTTQQFTDTEINFFSSFNIIGKAWCDKALRQTFYDWATQEASTVTIFSEISAIYQHEVLQDLHCTRRGLGESA